MEYIYRWVIPSSIESPHLAVIRFAPTEVQSLPFILRQSRSSTSDLIDLCNDEPLQWLNSLLLRWQPLVGATLQT